MSIPSIHSPSFQLAGLDSFASDQIFVDPMLRLAAEFDLQEIQDVQTNLFSKLNELQHESNRQIVHNHVRACARQLLLKLQNLRGLGATAQQLRQAGLDTLRELQISSLKMIQDFEHFQAGSNELDLKYSQFLAKADTSANSVSWSSFLETPVQNQAASSPLPSAISKYMIRPSVERPEVLATVVGKVQRIANESVQSPAVDSLIASFDAWNREKAMQNVATARVLAASIEGVSTVIGFGVSQVCRSTSTTAKACKAAGDLGSIVADKAKKVGKQALTSFIGSQKTDRILNTKARAYPERLMRLGIPKVMAEQAAEDSHTLLSFAASTAVGFGAGALAKTAVSCIFPAAVSVNRINYAKNYADDMQKFTHVHEFKGVLKESVRVINYHDAKPLGQGRSLKWAIPVNEANALATIEEVMQHAALISKWGERTHVTLSEIPAGTKVRFLHGAAKEQFHGTEFMKGGGTQYRFFDFDPKWIKEIREIPGLKIPPQKPLLERLDTFKNACRQQNRKISN